MNTPRLVLFFGLLGTIAPTANAQQQVMGSTLQNPANAQFGCEMQPRIGNTAGDYLPFASNQPDCTWTNTAGGTVPGDGTVQKVTIKSGPQPAKIRFVVLRTLAQPGVGQFCCFFVAESSIAQPTPNSTQSFVVNFPVERNTNPDTQVMTMDNIGVTAVSGTGTLPAYDNGRHNVLDPITPSLNASFWYPRVSSTSDYGSGVRPSGVNGFEVLLQTTFCPKGQEAACGLAPGGGAGAGPGGGGAPAAGVGAPPGGDRMEPVIGGIKISPTRVRRGSRAPKISISLSEQSSVSFDIRRPAEGRQTGAVCAAPTAANSGRVRCLRWVSVGVPIVRQVPAGSAQTVPSLGKAAFARLKPGRYSIEVTARDAAGNVSNPVHVVFAMVR